METQLYFIAFMIKGENWLLVKENEGKARIVPFKSISAAKSIFKSYQEAFKTSPENDNHAQDLLKNLLMMYPIIIGYADDSHEMKQYIKDAAPQKLIVNYLDEPYAMIKMRSAIQKFKVLDVLQDMANEMKGSGHPDANAWVKMLTFTAALQPGIVKEYRKNK